MTNVKGVALACVLAVAAAGTGFYFGGKNSGGEAAHGTSASSDASKPSGTAEKKPLYYRNPMGLQDTSPTPKKDPMGMDYVPVFAGDEGNEAANPGQLKFSAEKIQKLGVKTETALYRVLERSVRAAGRVEPDERRFYTIAPKFEGYVERLHVNVTGQAVGKGQALFEAYSPELLSAQREYVIAAQGVNALKDGDAQSQSGMKQLADSSLQRLKNWDVSEEQIKSLSSSSEAKRTLTYRSPVSGIVMEKKAVQGMRFMPGEALYQIADLSSVWVVADVFEQDIGLVKVGSKASVQISAYPDKKFTGTITYVYPTLNAETRTVPVRIELANPGLMLKPSMFAQVELSVASKEKAVSIPLSAVIDSGTRQMALVALSDGRFEPRDVKLGARSSTYVEVLEGIKEGDSVVVAANFLIDAESNLKAAAGGFTKQEAKANGHQAIGAVVDFDAKEGTIDIDHAAIASLKWPAMTMQFKVANQSLLEGLKPGAKVTAEFVERKPGEWVVTSLTRQADGAVPAAKSADHSAHTGK